MNNLIQIAGKIYDPIERLRFWQGRSLGERMAATFEISTKAYGIEKNSEGNWPRLRKDIVRQGSARKIEETS